MMERRSFIKKTSLVAAGLSITGTAALSSFSPLPKNKLPRWKGFNLLDFFSPNPANSRP
jgi:hypothetical protein